MRRGRGVLDRQFPVGPRGAGSPVAPPHPAARAAAGGVAGTGPGAGRGPGASCSARCDVAAPPGQGESRSWEGGPGARGGVPMPGGCAGARGAPVPGERRCPQGAAVPGGLPVPEGTPVPVEVLEPAGCPGPWSVLVFSGGPGARGGVRVPAGGDPRAQGVAPCVPVSPGPRPPQRSFAAGGCPAGVGGSSSRSRFPPASPPGRAAAPPVRPPPPRTLCPSQSLRTGATTAAAGLGLCPATAGDAMARRRLHHPAPGTAVGAKRGDTRLPLRDLGRRGAAGAPPLCTVLRGGGGCCGGPPVGWARVRLWRTCSAPAAVTAAPTPAVRCFCPSRGPGRPWEGREASPCALWGPRGSPCVHPGGVAPVAGDRAWCCHLQFQGCFEGKGPRHLPVRGHSLSAPPPLLRRPCSDVVAWWPPAASGRSTAPLQRLPRGTCPAGRGRRVWPRATPRCGPWCRRRRTGSAGGWSSSPLRWDTGCLEQGVGDGPGGPPAQVGELLPHL